MSLRLTQQIVMPHNTCAVILTAQKLPCATAIFESPGWYLTPAWGTLYSIVTLLPMASPVVARQQCSSLARSVRRLRLAAMGQ